MGWLKKFRPAQNILGPVIGQGKSLIYCPHPPKKNICCSSEPITNKRHRTFYDAESLLKILYHFISSSQANEETDVLLADDHVKSIASPTIKPDQTLAILRLVLLIN